MENEDTEYVKGSDNDFTHYIFSNKPKDENIIKLELDTCSTDIKIGLHIFQELLMIFTGGLRYLFGITDNGNKVNILELEPDNIELMNKYFKSFGFSLEVNKFTIEEYLSNMKLPNYFVNKELIEDNTPLNDIYYETSFDGLIFRVTFDFLR
tara:strand:+ start:2224 stop:2679 length:456 start_codon:yes stop_codon:yes gene_type:complete